MEWYFKLPLTVALSPTEIPLNSPMVLNDTEWNSMVFSGIPLALFCKGYVVDLLLLGDDFNAASAPRFAQTYSKDLLNLLPLHTLSI